MKSLVEKITRHPFILQGKKSPTWLLARHNSDAKQWRSLKIYLLQSFNQLASQAIKFKGVFSKMIAIQGF